MATPIAVNDVVRMVIYTFLNGASQLGLNVHYLKAATLAGAPTIENQIVNADSQFRIVIPPLMTNTATYLGITLQKWMATPLPEPYVGPSANVAGTAGTSPLPPDDSGIITWKTGLAGRKFRGRSYVPFPDSNHNVAPGIPKPAYVTLLLGYTGLFIPTFVTNNGVDGVTWVKQIVHGRTPGSPMDGVVSAIPRKKWANQHRRGDYGAVNTTGPF